jgi:hypothetical protein
MGAFKPEEGLRRAAEYRDMASRAKKAENLCMMEDCLDLAFLEVLRVEKLEEGVVVILTPRAA